METTIYILVAITILLGVKVWEYTLTIKVLKASLELKEQELIGANNLITRYRKKLKEYDKHYTTAYNQNIYYKSELEETRTILEVYQTLYGE